VADAPWRCSQCGTINEPAANACRACGRWPSLFDLEESQVDEYEVDEEPVVPEAGSSVEAEELEPEVFDAGQAEGEEESPSARGRRILGSIIVPLAVVIYLVISIVVDR
jgi:predicted ATP-dependent serine protease